jgi:hypothetical protein
MAEIWFAGGRRTPAPAGSRPFADLPLPEIMQKLGLRKHHRYAGIENRGLIDRSDGDDGRRDTLRYVVVVVNEAEAAEHGWEPGFYLAPLWPAAAKIKLTTG